MNIETELNKNKQDNHKLIYDTNIDTCDTTMSYM